MARRQPYKMAGSKACDSNHHPPPGLIMFCDLGLKLVVALGALSFLQSVSGTQNATLETRAPTGSNGELFLADLTHCDADNLEVAVVIIQVRNTDDIRNSGSNSCMSQQMFEWTWDSIAAECSDFIGPAGKGVCDFQLTNETNVRVNDPFRLWFCTRYARGFHARHETTLTLVI